MKRTFDKFIKHNCISNTIVARFHNCIHFLNTITNQMSTTTFTSIASAEKEFKLITAKRL